MVAGTQTKPNHPDTVAGTSLSVGNPSSGTLPPPAYGSSVLQLCCGDRSATMDKEDQPVSGPAQRGAAEPQRGLTAGTQGVPGRFTRLQCIPEPWRTVPSGSSFQGKWTILQVCPPAPPHYHLGTPIPLQRHVGAVFEEGKEGGRHDPELSRSQEMSPKKSRGSCEMLCSACRNSQASTLDIFGTARSHTLVPASVLGQGQRPEDQG